MSHRQPPSGMRLLAGRIGGVAGSLVAGQVLLGLTYVVAARSMDPAGLGLVATCLAIGTIGATLYDLGLTAYLVREVASGAVSLARARSLVGAKRRLLPLLVAPTAGAAFLIMPTPAEAAVLGLVGWAVLEAQTANSLLRAQERFTHAASGQLAGRLSGLVITVALLMVGPAELALSVGIVASFAVEAGLGRAFLGPTGVRAAAHAELMGMHRRTFSFGFVSLAAMGQQLDTPLVTLGGGAAAGGIYAGAGRLLGPLLFLSSSLALVGAPWLARAQRDPEALRAEERRIGRTALVICLGPLAAAALGPAVIPWLLGDQYLASGSAFAVLAIGAAFSTINQGMAVILQNRGAESAVGRGIGVGLVLGLGSTYTLVVIGGPVWAAAGFTVSQLYIVAHLALAVRRTAGTRGHHPGHPVDQKSAP